MHDLDFQIHYTALKGRGIQAFSALEKDKSPPPSAGVRW
jgi:hypothetical protein